MRALQPFVAVASVLLRFVLLLPPNQALERQRSDRRSCAGHNPRRHPSLLSTASAVDHRLPDGNAPQAKPVPGLTGAPLMSAGGGSLHPEHSRFLGASPESVGATTGFLTPGVKGAHAPGAAIIIRRDEHCIDEPASYCWPPYTSAEVVPLVMRSQKTAKALRGDSLALTSLIQGPSVREPP